MLFKSRFHPGIESGEITLTFRKWASARVKPGNRYRCPPIGVLEVDTVEPIAAAKISDAEAARSGFRDRMELLDFVSTTSRAKVGAETLLFRVHFRFVGADETPRAALPETIAAEAIAALADKLADIDKRSRSGRWTRRVLGLIAEQPQVAASRLCGQAGLEKAAFKAKVRQLKKLGLTVSFESGYELSPGGRRVLDSLDGERCTT